MRIEKKKGHKNKCIKMDLQLLFQASLNHKVQKRRKHFTGGHTRTCWEKQFRGRVAGMSYISDVTTRIEGKSRHRKSIGHGLCPPLLLKTKMYRRSIILLLLRTDEHNRIQ